MQHCISGAESIAFVNMCMYNTWASMRAGDLVVWGWVCFVKEGGEEEEEERGVCVAYVLTHPVYRQGRLPQMKHRSGISLYVHKLPEASGGACYCVSGHAGRKNVGLCNILRLSRIGLSFLSYRHHGRGGLRGCEGCERAICVLRMEAVSKRYRRARCSR